MHIRLHIRYIKSYLFEDNDVLSAYLKDYDYVYLVKNEEWS